MPGCLKDLRGADGADRQGLGGAVGGEHLDAWGKEASEALQDRGCDRRSGGDGAPERRELHPVLHAVAPHPVDEGGGAEHGGDAVGVDGVDDLPGIHRPRAGEVHFRDDGGHAERRGEQGEEREGREVDLAGLYAVDLLQRPDLRGEVAVVVDGALGRPGAAAGEEDGGYVLCLGRGRLEGGVVPVLVDHPGKGGSLPEEAGAYRHAGADGVLPPAEEEPCQVRLGDADERVRLGLGKALPEVLDPQPRIDQHRDGADLEEGEGEGEELRARSHHEHGAHAAADAAGDQPPGYPVAQPVELREAHAPVLPGEDDRLRVRLALRHLRQVCGDVDHFAL